MTRRMIAVLAVAALAPRPTTARADSMAIQSAKAAKALKRGDGAAALEAYSNALRLWTPKDGKKAKSRLLAERAALHEKNRAWDEALEDLGKALALEPKNAKLLHRRGRIRLEQGDSAKALDDLYKAISLDLAFRDAYFDRARAYELHGDAKFAREDYRAACRLGHKGACGIVKPSQPKKHGGRGPKARKKADMNACLRTLETCAQEGGSYENCVSRARICGDDPETGCCPAACAPAYRKLVNDGKSEAAAFRETFDPERPCDGGDGATH